MLVDLLNYQDFPASDIVLPKGKIEKVLYQINTYNRKLEVFTLVPTTLCPWNDNKMVQTSSKWRAIFSEKLLKIRKIFGINGLIELKLYYLQVQKPCEVDWIDIDSFLADVKAIRTGPLGATRDDEATAWFLSYAVFTVPRKYFMWTNEFYVYRTIG